MKKGTVAATATAAFALANLYLLSLIGPLVSPQHELVFHLPGSATVFFVPVLLDIVLVFGILTAALLLSRRSPRLDLLLWSGLLCALPSGLINTIYGFNDFNVPLSLGWPVALVTLVAFLAINLRPGFSLPHFSRLKPRILLLLGFLALPQLLLFLQLAWYGWEARDLNPPFTPAATHTTLARTQSQPRILWLLLDELSFDQVYGHRYPGLALPNFDRLAQQSTNFTNAVAAAQYTRRALPSMITGKPLRRTQPSASGQHLTLYDLNSGAATRFNPQDTVFSDAQRAGVETAIAGWYEPYCRLLPGVLNRCFWTYHDELPAGLTDNGTLLQHTLEPFLHFVRLSTSPTGLGPVMPTHGALDVRRHRTDYLSLLRASDELLNSGQPGLILIHMPIPHPWGFFDRKTATFPDHRTSYLDNLALADLYIGRVRAELERENLWNSTAVLVMGDHSWRTATVWAGSAHWTPEEQAASHNGLYDPRPAYLLKLPDQQTAATIDEAYSAVRTRSLIDALLASRLSTPDDLHAWVRGGSPPASPPAHGAHSSPLQPH